MLEQEQMVHVVHSESVRVHEDNPVVVGQKKGVEFLVGGSVVVIVDSVLQ